MDTPVFPWYFRPAVLALIASLCFGSYFALDSIQNLATALSNDGISDADFGALYAAYNFPNVILPFFGGVFADKVGLPIAAIVLAGTTVVGTALVALAPMAGVGVKGTPAFFPILLVGRAIFGAGAESLNVTQIAIIALWYGNSPYLSLAFALVLSVSRLGDFLSISFGATIARRLGHGSLQQGYDGTLWVAFILCCLGLLATIIYFFVDRHAVRKYRMERPAKGESMSWRTIAAVRKFDLRFWMVSLLCMTYYSGVIPFVAFLTAWLHSKYGYSEDDAGRLSSVVILASMILSPFLGAVVDKIGRRPLVAMAGSLLILPSHLALAFTGPNFEYTVYPLWPVVAVGLSFSLVPAALWPCVPLVVPVDKHGTAFGVMTAIQNSGLALVNLFVNMIRGHYGDFAAMAFFVVADCLGLIFALLLHIVDQRRDGALSVIKGGEKEDEQVKQPLIDESFAYNA